MFALIFEGEVVGFEVDVVVEEVVWLIIFGFVEGIGLLSFVCNLIIYKIKSIFVRKFKCVVVF